MFGYRNDGKKVTGMNIIDKAEPFFMPQRIDAVNYTAIKIVCDPMDDFIARKRKEGEHYNYMYIQVPPIRFHLLFLQHNMKTSFQSHRQILLSDCF